MNRFNKAVIDALEAFVKIREQYHLSLRETCDVWDIVESLSRKHLRKKGRLET